jgi:hypothetical protein
MAITRANLACLLLDTLASTGVQYAVLHGEDRIADGQAESDVDVVIGSPPHQVVRSLAPLLAASGLCLGLVWPYDVCALTAIWLVAPGPDGVRLDLVCDPDGQGRYGVRTDALLHRRVRGRCWWRLDGHAERLYLLSKRAEKRDRPGTLRLLDIGQADRQALVRLSGMVLADWRQPRIVRLLDGGPDSAGTGPPLRVRLLRAQRLADRARHGIGCWLTVAGDPSGQTAVALHRSFARVLPRARILDTAAPPLIVLRAQLERRRAGLAISRPVPGGRPDLALSAGEPGLTRRVLHCLAGRAEQTLRAVERTGER